MARVIFEGFSDKAAAQEFGRLVLNQVQGYKFRPGVKTYDDDLIHEIEVDPAAGSVTLVENTVGGTPELRNFNYLMATLGEDAAYDYLVKHVKGGANLVRDMFPDRVQSAQIVQKYGVGASRGFIVKETNEYVLGGNIFTKQGGRRVKLPN
jgi:hypothetical protein